MNPLPKVYWLRVVLGIVSAFLCAGYGIAVEVITNRPFFSTEPETFYIGIFLNSLTITLAVYLISYYFIKRIFILKVEKPQKLATMGIGIYFITWLIFWVLLYTIIAVA